MKYLNYILVSIGIVCLFLVVKSSEDTLILSDYEWLFGQFDSGNSIVFDIAVGILVSILFYYIVVYIPESSRKTRIKRNFIYQYKEFRKRLIYHMLRSGGEPFMMSQIDELMDVKKFRDYFNERVNESQNRWYSVRNNLDNQRLSSILLEFESLHEEITIVLINIDIQNQETLLFLHRIRTLSIVQKNVRIEDYLGFQDLVRLLWAMLAGFSPEGYTDYDHFERLLDNI